VTYAIPDGPAGEKQYELFKKVLLQLTGKDLIMGDLTGKWVIFADGYVHGLVGYESAEQALMFARHMRVTSYVVALVDVSVHDVNPLELLAFGSLQVDQPDDSPHN
jgi:hypothetical protein